MIELYTDGSCLKNPNGPGGWAVCILEDDLEYVNSEVEIYITEDSNTDEIGEEKIAQINQVVKLMNIVYVDGVSYGESWQWWLNAAGGGTRSSVMFPIVARYTNANTTAKSIVVKVYNHTDADTVTVSGNTSTWLKITEIGR